jgi:hypothetical protein
MMYLHLSMQGQILAFHEEKGEKYAIFRFVSGNLGI